MARKADYHLNLNQLPTLNPGQPKSGASTGNSSPIEQASTSARSPFGLPGALGNGGPPGSARMGAGSPSHELGSRLFPKRAREIQAQEGLTTPMLWGPPASGGSTPLRETIPESPSQDGFPDFMPSKENGTQATDSAQTSIPGRRARAGTVPSRFSPVVGANTPSSSTLVPKTSRPSPSTSPFRPLSTITNDTQMDSKQGGSSAANSTFLSRMRAGSLPQRSNALSSNPFGSSVFASSWGAGRQRGSTLASIRSSNDPDSPAQSSFNQDGLKDSDVKTLDYLGLAETPQSSSSNSRNMASGSQPLPSASALPPHLAELVNFNKNLSRFRSYSVNAKEKYAQEEEEEYGTYSGLPSGTLTPSAAYAAAALAQTQAEIHQHNLAVQAFANQASATRPRARTAGVLDSPLRTSNRGFITPSGLGKAIMAADLLSEQAEYAALPDAVRALQLGAQPMADASEETGIDGPTRALWLGSIPTSTTTTSLQALFSNFGKIESCRVLVQKNCGFVNFEDVDSAMRAKAAMNGKEIFPGGGPVRIGYAKAPTSSAGTPGAFGTQRSPSPDPFGKGDSASDEQAKAGTGQSIQAQTAAAALHVPDLLTLKPEILSIVQDFGAGGADLANINHTVDNAVAYDDYQVDIPPIAEPSHARMHDAPRLREIRKRIDNNAISQTEIEEIALSMLPEIAELASDYLGNTVVQKLFEFCSEPVKESMLSQIAPHLAEIGVHKNGTWAAQKIIDVSKDPAQINMIVQALRPYAVPLYLDQYGNYVLQCCLRFGYPYNGFIFEAMLSRMWEIAQGRFGARAMRACLESHYATKDQQRVLAAAIALHSVQLATNANGALLLTWYLDTCNFSRRRAVLAPRLIPHLVHLCTHKVAYLTVLKVINQRSEADAKDMVVKALFFSPNDRVLEDILSDQACGATLIFKIITTPSIDESMRNDVLQNIRNVLQRLKAAPSQGYKRLMDEVGLSSRPGGRSEREHSNGGSPFHDRVRPSSQPGVRPGLMQRQNSGPYPVSQAGFGGPGVDISAFNQFGLGNAMFSPTPMTPQQLQYQQALLQAQRNMSPTGAYAGFPTSSASFDDYRVAAGSAMSTAGTANLPGAAFQPPGFSQVINPAMVGGFPSYQMQGFPQQQIQQQQGGRRGRQGNPNR